jgi:tetratricopeptide (TPR) repeat protein
VGAEPVVLNARALALRALKRFDEAIEDLTRATRQQPGNTEFLFNQSQCLFESGKYDDAVDSLTRALAATPSDARCVCAGGLL